MNFINTARWEGDRMVDKASEGNSGSRASQGHQAGRDGGTLAPAGVAVSRDFEGRYIWLSGFHSMIRWTGRQWSWSPR